MGQTHPQLSVQLYTVREAAREDLRGALARLAELGFANVEPFAITEFPGLADAMSSAGLTAPTAHASITGDDAERVFETAAALGVRTVIEPYIPPERWQTADDIARNAEALAQAAETASQFGLRVGYHNHDHELASVIDGTTALERFAALIGDEIALEVDTYWVAVGGVDPVALLPRLGAHVVALHVKDGPATKNTEDQVAVGSGSLPIREIIDAAPDALRVVELDDCRGDRFQAVADSIRYLREEGLA